MKQLKPIALAALILTGCGGQSSRQTLSPATMVPTGSVSPRFQSYNIEMVELTGGRFWKPYVARPQEAKAPATGLPPGTDTKRYEYRPPIDLANPRLRRLAAALGPAYVRYSGTWANSTYFAADGAVPATPPPGFDTVLTPAQWQGAIDFARATGAEIVTSFAVSPGTRAGDGSWNTAQAARLLAFTTAQGGKIAAAEFANEPNIIGLTNPPAGYDAADYGRDYATFVRWIRAASPQTLVLSPGAVGDAGAMRLLMRVSGLRIIDTDKLLAATPGKIDGFGYHHYGAVSQRCLKFGPGSTSSDSALSENWLARTDATAAAYAAKRDRFAPGTPLWLTETADAACGGNPWAPTFVDAFRYVDQLGRLAQRHVAVVMHNTLAASDYGMLDETSFAPRPKYWAALLWRRLMGTTVLDPGITTVPELHVYAQCLRDVSGGVALLAINLDRVKARPLALPQAAQRYTLTAARLDATDVALNGQPLALVAGDALPALTGTPAPAGAIMLAPASINFFAFPQAGNQACRT